MHTRKNKIIRHGKANCGHRAWQKSKHLIPATALYDKENRIGTEHNSSISNPSGTNCGR